MPTKYISGQLFAASLQTVEELKVLQMNIIYGKALWNPQIKNSRSKVFDKLMDY